MKQNISSCTHATTAGSYLNNMQYVYDTFNAWQVAGECLTLIRGPTQRGQWNPLPSAISLASLKTSSQLTCASISADSIRSHRIPPVGSVLWFQATGCLLCQCLVQTRVVFGISARLPSTARDGFIFTAQHKRSSFAGYCDRPCAVCCRVCVY